jgi:hypothetical protein
MQVDTSQGRIGKAWDLMNVIVEEDDKTNLVQNNKEQKI